MDLPLLHLCSAEGEEVRQLEPDDAYDLFCLIETGRVEFQEWFDWVDKVSDPGTARRFINLGKEQCFFGMGMIVGIWKHSRLVGVIPIPALEGSSVELAYMLSPAVQGQGVMCRALQMLCEWFFEEADINRLGIYCSVENARSKHVAERLGFKEESVQQEFYYDAVEQRYKDALVMVLLRSEWSSPKKAEAHESTWQKAGV